MPQIKQYTRQILPRELSNVNATPQAFGGDVSGQMAQANSMAQIANAFSGTADITAGIAQRINTREETIARMRASDNFYNEVMTEFERAQTEDDMVDPATSKKFAETARGKMSSYLSNYKGSPDSRAKLEAQLLDTTTSFTTQMTANAHAQQRGFIMSKAGQAINAIAAKAQQDPANLTAHFLELGDKIKEIAPTLRTDEELDLIARAQEQVSLSALNGFVDAGKYQDAKDLINQNPEFLNSLTPGSQRQILGQIEGGIRREEEDRLAVKKKLNAIKTAATELGVDVSGPALFAAVTGVSEAASPQSKVDEFAKITGVSTDKLPQSVIAKIGFGVDLPSPENDPNKEYTPEGKLTVKGIGSKIKPQIDAASSVVVYGDKVIAQADEFLNNGNRQAAMASLISFQKMIDDGAVVREGDIRLAQSAQSLTERITLATQNLATGQSVSNEMMQEMKDAAVTFREQTLRAAKVFVDPYVTDARERGMRGLDYGLPEESYKMLFGGIRDEPAKTPAINPAMKKIQEYADKNKITIDEAINKYAKASGANPDDIKKKLGL